MSYFFDKTPPLSPGFARSVMNHILMQVKTHRGLTSFIERNGINGRWLKPDNPYNIRISKFFKIMEIKAHYQTDDEFLDEWNAIGHLILHIVRLDKDKICDYLDDLKYLILDELKHR